MGDIEEIHREMFTSNEDRRFLRITLEPSAKTDI